MKTRPRSITRSLRLVLCLSGGVAFCGPLGIGVKAGVPVTELVMSSFWSNGAAAPSGGRYVIGPTVELRLPFGLGIEANALYRHVNNPSASAWEFPILAKYRILSHEGLAPYAVAGGAFQRNDLLRAFQVGPSQTISGFVLGGGVEAKLSIIRLAPEIRYTHWTGDFSFRGFDLANRNQLEFLVGLTF